MPPLARSHPRLPISILVQSRLRQHARTFRTSPRRLLSEKPSFSTVNDAEIAHFSRLSDLWWDERGEFALLHKMNAHRMRFVREKLLLESVSSHSGADAAAPSRALTGMDVLDVGCGGGILSESLARLGANTLAVDASEENIGVASRHAAADPRLADTLAFRHSSVEELVQQPRRFDVVCSMEVVEHVDNPSAFVRSCAELVKPGGHLFLSTVARTPLAYLLTIIAAEKLLRMVESGTHTYSKFINPDELVGFFAKPLKPGARPWISRTYAHGLPTRTEAEVRGIVYVPWRGDWVLAPRSTTPWSTQANYLFWVRRPLDA